MRRVAVRIAFRDVSMAAAGIGALCGAGTLAAAGIGAAFGIEWRFDLDHAGPQPFHHRLDDVIAPDTQALRHDLRRQMAVAEMPGDPNQVVRVGTPYLDKRLRRRDN